MKKLTAILLVLVFALSLASCGKKSETTVLKVGASPTPHAEILNFVKDDLAKQGIDLQVIEFDDYVLPKLHPTAAIAIERGNDGYAVVNRTLEQLFQQSFVIQVRRLFGRYLQA